MAGGMWGVKAAVKSILEPGWSSISIIGRGNFGTFGEGWPSGSTGGAEPVAGIGLYTREENWIFQNNDGTWGRSGIRGSKYNGEL